MENEWVPEDATRTQESRTVRTRQEMLLNMANKKNPAAVVLGRLGGKVKAPKGFAKMDPRRLAEVARKGGRSVKTLRKNLGNRLNSA
jgi:general stress protein YciG